MDNQNLPSLTVQQNAFVFHLFTDSIGDRAKAYKLSYDCKNSSEKTIYEEASKLLKHPKITPWIAYYEQSLQEFQENEIKYTRQDFFNELDRIRAKTEDTKNVSVALKAVELKGKAVVQMGNVEVQGEEIKFDVGADVDDSSRDT